MLSTLNYVVIGAGIPVFTGFSGGIGSILGPTGGFILSFPILALTDRIRSSKDNKIYLATWLIIGAVINHICGMLMFNIVMSSGLQTAFSVSVPPFIPATIIEIILLVVLIDKIKRFKR